MSAASNPPVPMLRPALELAWAVAKVGTQSKPAVPAPGPLRPLMRAAKLPDRMLATVRSVLDDDADFRARVEAAADETLLGRAPWLWLTRPDGWQEELESIVAAAESARAEVLEKKDARLAQRQLDEASAALQRVQAELVSLQAANADLESAAASDRQNRRTLERNLSSLRTELDAARSELEEQHRLGAGAAELLAESESRSESSAHHAVAAADERDAAREEARILHLAVAEAERREAAATAEAGRLRSLLWDAFAAARKAAGEAGLDAVPDSRDEPPPEALVADRRPSGEARPSRVARRAPVKLPPAIFDDSDEAAQHLVRYPGAELIVDGYNVTISSWPGLELPAQRRRLVDSMAELVARSGPRAHLVFDGVDAGNRLQPSAAARGRLKIQFSPSEIEADEVIIDLVASLPADQAVIVATDDRRVRDRVAGLGANTISVDQLLAVLRRGAGGGPA